MSFAARGLPGSRHRAAALEDCRTSEVRSRGAGTGHSRRCRQAKRGRCLAGSRARQQLEKASQSLFDGGQPFARVAAKQLGDRDVFRDRRQLPLDAAPDARERQPFDKEQMFDPQDPLDISSPIHPVAAPITSHAQIRKFRLPRTQDVRLKLRDFTDLRRFEQRAIGNLNFDHRFSTTADVKASDNNRRSVFRDLRGDLVWESTPEAEVYHALLRRTCTRIGVPIKLKRSRN